MSRKTQTALFSARLFAAAELSRTTCRSWFRVRRPLSPAPGDPPFVLRQRSQKSLLLPRLRSGRRSAAFYPVVSPAVFPPKSRLPPTARGCFSRSCGCARAGCRILSTATRALPRGAALSVFKATIAHVQTATHHHQSAPAGAARKLLRHCLISRILVGGGRHARWATTVSCNSLENNFGTPVLCVQFYLSQLSRQAANSLGLI